jgi:hypothetical protein
MKGGGNTAQWADYPGLCTTLFSADILLISVSAESAVWMVLYLLWT